MLIIEVFGKHHEARTSNRLLKLEKQRKSTPFCDPDPYSVALSGDETTTRNSSCFKLFRHNDADEPFHIEMPTTTSPAADVPPLHEQPIAQADSHIAERGN